MLLNFTNNSRSPEGTNEDRTISCEGLKTKKGEIHEKNVILLYSIMECKRDWNTKK